MARQTPLPAPDAAWERGSAGVNHVDSGTLSDADVGASGILPGIIVR
ncbi:hypothetical protein AAGU66_14975 [Edwardsiella ictaluri]|nr:hypothetical protein [Edwardsiella ictaluri]QPW31173.1 hypothetical protein F8539_15525 [Edwardsiella ictaluri]UYB61330.1 hypothetical protein N8I66_15500 [Edwardsiella ictaluri]UYB64557.1 hypothetical protein N8I67_15495 [Edwardsiella ictaluri]BEI00286.1 hypothetical protein KH20906_30130 [Edwardsiella ictaluri]BEI03762.1 hypothetical protein KB20921_30230 [Edwardsiella ictaluri]